MNLVKKKIGPISLWWIFLVGFFALMGVIVGSFVDLEISKVIAKNGNTFGKIVESYIPMLGCSVATISGAIITKPMFRKECKKRVWLSGILLVILVIVIPAFFSASYVTGQSGYSWKYNKWIGFSWLILLYIGIYFLVFYFVDGNLPTKVLVRNGLYILAGFIITEVVINTVLKGLIYRPRYRALAWDNLNQGTAALGFDYYQNWWSFAFWKKPEWFYDLGIPSDYIKSWPSGHTATSACLLLLPFASTCLKKRSTIIDATVFIIATIFVIITALGRMIAGAHFLSDVSSAIFITLFLMFLPCILVDKITSKIFDKEKCI